MTVTIHVPSMLRAFSGDSTAEFRLSASTIRAALEQLRVHHPAIHQGICDETGSVRRHVNLFVNDSLVRNGLDAALQPGDDLTIMPAVSGG